MNLFDLSAKLTLDSSEYEKGISQSEGLGKKFTSAISAKTVALGQMLGNFATQAISKVSSAVKDLIKESIGAYADYEQLVGGVETLFGAGGKSLEQYAQEVGGMSDKTVADYNRMMDAQNLVMENASKAYKTAGLSANEYMEMSTSFAASLISSLRGDTYEAAIYADMAMQDMADNANKMGTDMSSIQSAYQGFAKQNYMMLDNLKLGYGGTKTEMERLLADATKISGRKFNIESLADIYEAIHIIQQEMGITGTTAKEAEGTISGSINMMKASWQNLLVALGDPDADLGAKIDEFSDSFKSVVKNLLPVFKRALKNVWKGLTEAVASFGGLIFGRDEQGEVNWPAWSDVQTAALNAWEWIKEKAADLAGLVFGKNSDGTVAWPTWDDVKAKADEAWKGIKEGAKALAGLVFGKKADGSVDWPTWEDVKAKATKVWKGIKAGALTLKGLVFGDASDAGSVFGKIQEAWASLKDTIEQGAINIATYFFGDADPATVASTIKTIGDVLEAVGVAIVTYFTVKKVQGIIDFFKNFKSIFTTAVGGNKIGLILSAIAAAITLIVENWDKIEPVIQQIGGWIQENLIEPINDFIDSIKEAIKAIGEFFGIDTSGWFGGNQQGIPADTSEHRNAAGYSTAHLDLEQINSLAALRELIKQNPNAAFQGTDGQTRSGAEALKHTFEETMKAAGFNDSVIKNFSDKLANISDEGFKDLMTQLANAEGFYDEAGNKIGGLSDGMQVATGSVEGLGTAASNAASQLNSVKAPDYSSDGSHAKGLWDVPYDDYVARLHRNEMVLTASEARRYRQGTSGNVDLSSLGDIVREAISSGMSGATVRSYISGRDITDDVNRQTVRQLKARRFAT